MVVAILPFLFAPAFVLELAEDTPGTTTNDLASIPGLAEMTNLLEGLASPRPTGPQNPCLEDLRKLGCSSAACLEAQADRLSESCSRFLANPMAQPASRPMALPVSRPMPQSLRADVEAQPGGMPESIFELSIMGGDGFEIDFVSDSGMSSLPDLLSGFTGLLESDLLSDLTGLLVEPVAAARAAEPVATSHPCADEITSCAALGGLSTRSEIEECLLDNLEALSAECRCFLHQTLPTSRAQQLNMVAAPSAETFAIIEVDDVYEYVPVHSCVLVVPLFMLAVALILRRCFLCFCHTRPHFEAVVLPEAATIKTVEPLVYSAPLVKTVAA